MRDESDPEDDVGESGAGARVGGKDGWGDGTAGYWEDAWHGWRLRLGREVMCLVMMFDGSWVEVKAYGSALSMASNQTERS